MAESQPLNKPVSLLWIKNLPLSMTEIDVRHLSEEAVGIRIEGLRDESKQVRKVLIGYETEEATLRNYERLKGITLFGINLEVQIVQMSSAIIYIPILTSEEEILIFDEIGFDDEADRLNFQRTIPRGQEVIPLGNKEWSRPVGYASRLAVDRGKIIMLHVSIVTVIVL